MRERLRVRLGLLGFLAGFPFALMGLPFLLLPLVTTLSGIWLGDWLYRHAGRVSLPTAALLGTPVCALICGVVYGAGMGLVTGEPSIAPAWALALALGGAIYSVLFAPFSALIVRSICRRPFTPAPFAPASDSGHPYRPI